MAPLDASAHRSPAPLSARVPFHPPQREQERTALRVEGELPPWLAGNLLRTCPAIFERGPWRAKHLFDGLGMLYGFELADGQVWYRNRYLRGQQWDRIEAGRGWKASWGDGPQRSWLRRLVQPVPESTDNANVNLGRVGDDFVAMTETPHQLRFDPRTLETLGAKHYDDSLGEPSMIAHPHADPRTGEVVSVAIRLGARSQVLLYRVEEGRRREVIATKDFDEVPYVHDFGITEHHALLVLHPFGVRPTSMLWSNKGISDHFRWDGGRPTRLAVIDRRDGSWREVEVQGPPFFVFHVANAFERDDGELVLDLLAYPDAGIVQALGVQALLDGPRELGARLERIRVPAGAREGTREALVDAPFEFPRIDYRRRSAKPYRYCWGANNEVDAGTWSGEILRVDTHHGEVRRHARPGYNLGEPVFVPRDRHDPRPEAESDGVLLSVASDLQGDRAELLVLDASTLSPLASAAVDDAIPLGFHGQFFAR